MRKIEENRARLWPSRLADPGDHRPGSMVVDEPPTLETTPVDLPPEIIALLAAFAPLFSDRAWNKAQVLAVGAILATGHRTVCSALRVMGLSRERHFTNYHRVLNRDAWSCLASGQVLLGLIVAVLPRDWPIVLAADDTIDRRSGRRIKAKYRSQQLRTGIGRASQ